MKPIKNFFCGILSAVMLLTTTVIPVFAKDDIKVIVDGKTLSFDVPPQIINDRTMVPLRGIFEALGATVEWKEDGTVIAQKIVSENDYTSILLVVGSGTMYVNVEPVTLDSPACIVEDRTLVPVRAISEAFGVSVEWDENNREVIINTEEGPVGVDNDDKASPYSKLKDVLIERGKYNDKHSAYTIYKDFDSLSVLLTYYPERNRIMITYFSEDMNTNVSITLSEEEEPQLIMTTNNNNLGDRTSYGKFSHTTHKYVELSSDMYSFEKESANALINITLKLFDTIIEGFDIGVSLEDFGIAYD